MIIVLNDGFPMFREYIPVLILVATISFIFTLWYIILDIKRRKKKRK
jgi:hypothetical protein